MNIAVVTPLFPTDSDPGCAAWLHSTVEALGRRSSVDVYDASPIYPPLGCFQPRSFEYERIKRDYSFAGMPVRVVPFLAFPLLSRPSNGLLCGQALLKTLRTAKPDVVLAYHTYPVGWAATYAAKRLGIPVVLCAIGSDLRRIPGPLTKIFVKCALLSADAVIAKSDELNRRAIQFGVAPTQVTTIRNGCDKSIFHVRSKSKVRVEFGISPEAEILLFVGKLTAAKGFHDLMEAANALIAERPNLHVVCIGQNSRYASAARRFPQLRSRLHLLGVLAPLQIAKWLSAADLICLPSHSEGCPNVLMEARSCGCPIVATKVGGIPEIVNETCGILVPSRDPMSLARAISAALSKSWNKAAISRGVTRGWDDVGSEIHAVGSRVVRSFSGHFGGQSDDREPEILDGSDLVEEIIHLNRLR